MTRDELINRLVAQKMATKAPDKAGCVPCFGSAAKAHCWAATKKLCRAPANPKR